MLLKIQVDWDFLLKNTQDLVSNLNCILMKADIGDPELEGVEDSYTAHKDPKYAN